MEEDDESMTRTSFFQRFRIRSAEKRKTEIDIKKSEPISDLENLVRIICVWCTRQESNLWPSESESDALSN